MTRFFFSLQATLTNGLILINVRLPFPRFVSKDVCECVYVCACVCVCACVMAVLIDVRSL